MGIKDFYRRHYEKMLPQQKDAPPLEEMVAYLLTVPDAVWGHYALRRDTLYNRLVKDHRIEELICGATDCGKMLAQEYMQRYETREPEKMLQRMKIELRRNQYPSGGGRVLFAQFTEPNLIEVFIDALDRAPGLGQIPELPANTEELEKILVAHELFHVVELENADTIFTNQYKITTICLGPIRNRSRVIWAGEIAAMSFTKELLELNFSPFLLDILLTYGYQPEAAGSLYWEVRTLNENAQNTSSERNENTCLL